MQRPIKETMWYVKGIPNRQRFFGSGNSLASWPKWIGRIYDGWRSFCEREHGTDFGLCIICAHGAIRDGRFGTGKYAPRKSTKRRG